MLSRVLNHRSKNVTRAALVLSVATFVSHLLGLFRDRLLAGTFGAGPELDIYFAAFRIPTLIQSVIITGGVGAVILPIFSGKMKKDKEKAVKFLNNILNVSLVVLLGLCVVLFVLTPWLSQFISPGFTVEQQEQLVLLTRVMYLSPLILGASLIFSNYLQYFDKFVAYGLASVFYNLGIVLGILFLVPRFGLVGLAYGVILGAVLHLLTQLIPSLLSGFNYGGVFNLKDEQLREVLVLMGPTALTALFIQLGLVATVALASNLFPGSISILNLVTRIKGVPVSLNITSFAIASFATLSRRWATDDKVGFWGKLSSVIRQVIFFLVPVSMLFYVLRAQIVRVVFQTGLWGWEDTRLAAATLGAFSFFMLFEGLVIILRKALCSIKRVGEATISEGVRLVVMVLSIVLFLFLFTGPEFASGIAQVLKVRDTSKVSILSFPFGMGLSSVVQAFILFFYLKKAGFKKEGQILASLVRVFIASICAALFSWIILRPLAAFLSLDRLPGLLLQMTVSSFGGVVLYLLISYVLSFPELEILKDER